MPERILILGGTGEARQAADELVGAGHHVVTSLAGLTREPALPKGEARRGGFGGADGLARYLKAERITVIIDASHPFAARISQHAHDAARRCSLLLLRLERPAWESPSDGVWKSVTDLRQALENISGGSKVLVTTGRKNLEALADFPLLGGVVRCIEAPDVSLPPQWELALERPPFGLEHELSLMERRGFKHLICKNAGGAAMLAKVTAANRLGLEVLMIERPAKPPCRTFASVGALIAAAGSLSVFRSAV